MSRYIFIVLILLYFSVPSISQQIRYGVQNFNVENGLLHGRVLCVFTDSDKYTWICTVSGLQLFDGEQFTNFQNVPNDSTSIVDNGIRMVKQGFDGNIWVGTSGQGFDIYDKKQNSFRRYQLAGTKKMSSDFYGFSSFIDPDKNIWLKLLEGDYAHSFLVVDTLYNPKIIKMNWSEASYLFGQNVYFDAIDFISVLKLPYDPKCEPNRINFPHGQSSFASCRADGYIWFGTKDSIYRFDPSNERFVSLQNILKNNGVIDVPSFNWMKQPNAMYSDFVGRLWVAKKSYLYEINLQNGKTERHSYITNDEHNRDAIRKIYGNGTGTMWVTYKDKGMSRVNLKTKRFQQFLKGEKDKHSLQGKTIRALFADEQNIWIGTFANGLLRYNFATKRFERFKLSEGEQEQNVGYSIKSITKDEHNRLWIAAGETNSVFFSDNFNQKQGNVRFRAINIDTTNVKTVYSDPQGRLWLGTRNSLYLFDNKRERFVPAIPHMKGLKVNCCLYQQPNILWVGTWRNGLLKLHLSRKENPHALIASIQQFRKNKLPNSLPDDRVMTLCFDEDSTLWLGTWVKGLVKKSNSHEETTFLVFNNTSGLSANCVYGILKGEKKYLWISTNSGLNRFDPKTETINTFYKTDGLITNAFFEGAYCKTDNALLFGGINGFVRFNPDSITLSEGFPKVLINKLSIQNKEVNRGDTINGRIVLPIDIKYAKELTLTPKDRSFSLEFVTPGLFDTQKIKFAYKLEGFQDEWIKTGSKKRFASYSNLRYGKYIFKVKVTNLSGEWNNDYTQLKINVLPTFWETPTAYLLYTIVLAFFVYALRNYWLARERYEHQIKMEKLEKEKSQEMNQMKLRFFTNITHEFRTPLTLILGPLEKLLLSHRWSDAVKEQLQLMLKNGNRLLRLIEQLIEFRKMETGNTKLKLSKSDVLEFIDEVTSLFHVQAKQQKIDYKIVHSIQTANVWFDRNVIETVVYNLLSNAFKFTKEGGAINLSTRFLLNKQELDKVGSNKNEMLEIVVKDSGVGISKDRLKSVFDRFYQVEEGILKRGSGIGLSLSKDLVELHKGSISVQSKLGEGTTFTVLLSVHKAKFAAKEIEEHATPNLALEPNLKIDYQAFNTEPSGKTDKEKDENTPQILIVEDDKEVSNYLAGILKENYRLTIAYNGKSGLQKATENAPDLIISDIMMPEMDGIEFCRKIKTNIHTCHIPVVLLTALTTTEDQIKGLETGADAYIPKPFNVEHLETRVRKLIELRNKLKQRFGEHAFVEPKDITVCSADERFLSNVIATIEENLSNPDLTVELIGKSVGMSNTHLYRKIKALTSYSTNEFIRNLRLKRAAELLQQQSGNVTEVMYSVGFSNRSYFSKCFKDTFGCSPKDYCS